MTCRLVKNLSILGLCIRLHKKLLSFVVESMLVAGLIFVTHVQSVTALADDISGQ